MRSIPGRSTLDPCVWMLVSPALPVGGYSYSQGLEHAVAAGWVKSFDDARGWIVDLATIALPRLDLPLLARIYEAAQSNDAAAVARWNAELLAGRETAELHREDTHMGRALARLCHELALVMPCVPDPPTFAASFALACAEWQIDLETACSAYAWVWCENQVAAAVKLVPLGQTQGQQVLLQLANTLPEIVTAALACPDEEIGFAAPGLAIVSSAHETQYSRLFRS